MKLKHLQIKAQCIAGPDERKVHIQHALTLGLPIFQPDNKVKEQPIALVGSGPSVRTQVDVIRNFPGPVMAIKGAHDFLIEHDIIPMWAVLIDPQTHIVKYFRHLRDDVIYLIASQVHPEVFKYFEGRRLVLCHMGDSATRDCVDPNTVMIPGGSTSGLRGLSMAAMMGYRDVHLFGFDSCLAADKVSRKVCGKEVIEPLKDGKERIDVRVNGRTFWADKAMAAQAFELQQILPNIRGIHVTAHGDGIIPEIVRCRKRLGMPDCGGELVNEPFVNVPFMTEGVTEELHVSMPAEAAEAA